jgi:hypothetical protein
MKKEVKKVPKLEGLVNEKEMLQNFAKEFQEYMETYRELVLTDGVAGMRDEIARAAHVDEKSPLETTDTSGLRRAYLSLVEFEKKYPFIDRNYSVLALQLPSIGSYLTKQSEKE